MGALLVVSRRSRRGWRGPAARSRAAYGETGRTRADLAREVGQDAVEGDGPEVLAAPVPEADGPVLALPLADDEHVRDLPELRLADPVAELLVAVVELRPQARGAELLPDRSEEHTSELQSLAYLVCRLLLEKKKKKQ